MNLRSNSEPTRRSKQRKPLYRMLLFTFVALYLLGLSLISLMQLIGPERFWWSALNLYLPQWIWALPGTGLLVGTLLSSALKKKLPDRYSAALIAISLVSLIWVAWPIMGFCWPISGRPPDVTAARLRVMTYNIKYYKTRNVDGDLSAIAKQITEAKPDLLLLQDASASLDGRIAELLRGWNVCAFGQYVIASRLPLSESHVGSISFFGHSHSYLRCQLQVGTRFISIYDVHLLTPRSGLAAIRYREGISEFESETRARLVQAGELAEDLQRETLPVIVAGDFNAPLASMVCRRATRGRLLDAFANAGRGYGYTYGHSLKFGKSFVRIDHVFVDPRLGVTDCWAGDASGSDHRPVIADIVIPR